MVLDSPHIVAIIDDGFPGMAVALRDAIGREFQGLGGQADHEQAGDNHESEAKLSHDGAS